MDALLDKVTERLRSRNAIGSNKLWLAEDGTLTPWTDPYLVPGRGRKGEQLDADLRLDLLCRAFLMYSRSANTLSDRSTPAAVQARTSFADLETSQYASFPERFISPWDGLEIPLAGGKPLLLLGYGSQMNKPSKGAVDVPRPLLILSNMVRMASLLHPTPEKSDIGLPTAGHERECTRYTLDFSVEMPEHLCNCVGRNFVFSPEELDRFRTRESGYDLVRVPVVPVHAVIDGDGSQPLPVEYGFVLCQQPERWRDLGRLADQGDLPHTSYIHMSLEGDETVLGAGFTRLVGDSSFLPDGRTVAMYLRDELLNSL